MTNIPNTAIYSFVVAVIWAISMFVSFYYYPAKPIYGLFCAGMSSLFIATCFICITIADNKEKKLRYELYGTNTQFLSEDMEPIFKSENRPF